MNVWTRAQSTNLLATHSELSKIKHRDQSNECGKYDISNIYLSTRLCVFVFVFHYYYYCCCYYFATMNMIVGNIVIE